ncbi:MAG: DUF4838 domain-containing protein, partial [Lachnospiraceae bacterium]|nr:DUF4838 domain-containing protein [Lachnospiraceae bacterium]
MLCINKITSDHVIDYAAEELKKYLRMMMPECGDVKICYNPDAREGFRLGLMQEFKLDVSDAEDPELDDILYIDTDETGGVIAGDNPRSVLLAVYEFFRQNGCRWLMPGVDGEFIPMKAIQPVHYRHKPSCRYRGQCNEGAEFQQNMIDVIEFMPKIGMNVFMIEFFIPMSYYRSYYNHESNKENRPAEPVSDMTVLQWKRQCETEIAKRGLQFHDIGHGFACNPFGLDHAWRATDGDLEARITPEQRRYLAQINGERKLYNKLPKFTNFCMSNTEARKLVVNYVADYAQNHSNVDFLHVWLADSKNNHCECEECRKKIPSDWYVILMNELDEELERRKLDTRIVFIAYTDTSWGPLEETIKNPKRFTLLFAPIYRSYTEPLPRNRENDVVKPYVRNGNVPSSGFGYLDQWKKVWKGANVAYEYHFWRHQCYDLSGLETARRVNEDVKIYKENNVNGIIQDGSQRSFFPNGLAFYAYARTLFDTSITYEEIVEDYLSHAYGEDWRQFRRYLSEIYEALPSEYFARDKAKWNEKVHYDPVRAEKIASIREITKKGRELIKANYNSEYRVRTVSMRLLERHAEFCDLISDWMAAKARGDLEEAMRLYNVARVECGRFEVEFEEYFDHCLYFSEYFHTQNQQYRGDKGIFA